MGFFGFKSREEKEFELNNTIHYEIETMVNNIIFDKFHKLAEQKIESLKDLYFRDINKLTEDKEEILRFLLIDPQIMTPEVIEIKNGTYEMIRKTAYFNKFNQYVEVNSVEKSISFQRTLARITLTETNDKTGKYLHIMGLIDIHSFQSRIENDIDKIIHEWTKDRIFMGERDCK
jgi:hypothetical protein